MEKIPDIAIVIPAFDAVNLHKTLESIVLQADSGVRVYVADDASPADIASIVADFEPRLDIRHHRFEENMGQKSMLRHLRRCIDLVGEEWTVVLSDDNELAPKALRRLRRAMGKRKEFDVYHWDTDIIDTDGNLVRKTRRYPRKTTSGKLFKDIYLNDAVAPLSSFVFRTVVLKEKYVEDAEAWRMDLATILSCAAMSGIRTVWRGTVLWREKAAGTSMRIDMDEKVALSSVRLFRWSEFFFGENYPLGTSDRLYFYAEALAALYPTYTKEELKEMMGEFGFVSGTVRKMRASSALKSAIKDREAALRQK